MKKPVLIVLFAICMLTLFAQQKLYIFKTDKTILGISVNAIDSIRFTDVETILSLFKADQSIVNIPLATIDSISFAEVDEKMVCITYSDKSVSFENPMEKDGVTVVANGTDVVVHSTNTDQKINYLLKGTTNNGSLKVYSSYQLGLVLSDLNLTNTDGPAINIQTGKKCEVTLDAGSSNFLTDGNAYAEGAEDQKGTFFSEGQLIFKGTGTLTVNGNYKNGICSDDYVEITDGTINIANALNDGIHSKDAFSLSGGSLNVKAKGDGVDCEGTILISAGSITTSNSDPDVCGIKCDSTLIISGGNVLMTLSGNMSKGIKSSDDITLSGGFIHISTSGAVVLETSGSGYNPSYCTAVKSDQNITVCGSDLNITSSGAGGKGFSSDGLFSLTSGTVVINCSGTGATYKNDIAATDSYNATCISSDGGIQIIGGTLTASTTSAAKGGKGLSTNKTITFGDESHSPTVNVTTLGTTFVVSTLNKVSDYCHPKTVVSDGTITINNGTIVLSSTDDGIHSETSVVQNGGEVSVLKSVEGVESLLIQINGGSMNISASDDAINATQGTTSGGTESVDNSYLKVTGGYLMASATSGDAVDSNGNILITGGTVIAHGPTGGANEDFDTNGTFVVNGGFVIGGSTNSNMNKTIATNSTQYGLYAKSTTGIPAGTIFRIQDANGNDVVTFKPTRPAYCIHFSSPELKFGSTYSILSGGTCTGVLKDGLYTEGAYSGGSARKSFTVSSRITALTSF